MRKGSVKSPGSSSSSTKGSEDLVEDKALLGDILKSIGDMDDMDSGLFGSSGIKKKNSKPGKLLKKQNYSARNAKPTLFYFNGL
jgi:hypothetical protein